LGISVQQKNGVSYILYIIIELGVQAIQHDVVVVEEEEEVSTL
jgi:ABC-type antimicrobial peptide transport system ATPase subunit